MPSRKTYSEAQFKRDLAQLNKLISSFKKQSGGNPTPTKGASDKQEDFTLLYGGARETPDVRNFTVVELNGQKIKNGGRYKISNLYTRGKRKGQRRKNLPTPGDAASKALSKFCRDMKNKNKTKCRVTFTLQEVTRGSSRKLYGPYYGYYRKLKTPVKMRVKDAKGKMVTRIFRYRPMVELSKK